MSIKRILLFILAAVMLVSVTACGKKPEDTEEPETPTEETETVADPETTVEPVEEPAEEPKYKPYQFDESKFVEYNGTVEHFFFHQIVAWPEMAFDGDSYEKGIDDWMCTADEFVKIMDELYAKGYILVDIRDVWSEYEDSQGNPFMMRNTLRIPEGRIPFVMSYDDISVYEYMPANGFMERLIIGEDGELWCTGTGPDGKQVTAQGLDIVTLTDKYIKEHPDFSLNGAKACLSLTGYAGILGYDTYQDSRGTAYYDVDHRAAEIEAVKPIIEKLKETGWYFGSHTWGHIRLDKRTVEQVKADTERWFQDVGECVGETPILFYPHGARPDGKDVDQTGPVFKYLHSKGFRYFFSVGTNSFSKVKTDISAVVGDRLHPDGTTLRWARKTYLPFYDAKDIYDDRRPDYGNSWDK
ncbi:MAG: polysaccharide deacetylase family protein [Oscillospiraceae bacterium]|nr:polysaccharide deacetylase family protein [Oscillospiraceae bacterium]